MATGVLSGTTSTYLYGYDGKRQKITVGAGVPSVTEYDTGGELMFETNSRVETDYAYLDGMPIAAIQPVAATVSAIHTDHLGTPQSATNASEDHRVHRQLRPERQDNADHHHHAK